MVQPRLTISSKRPNIAIESPTISPGVPIIKENLTLSRLLSSLPQYSGHQFLANIRSDNIWNGTKAIAAKIGSASIDALTQIASNVVTEIIKSHFNLH